MDVLQELDVNIDFIDAIGLDILSIAEDLEWGKYYIYTICCGSSLNLPLLNGVLHTPPGYMLYGKDLFGHNVLIKAINGKNYILRKITMF